MTGMGRNAPEEVIKREALRAGAAVAGVAAVEDVNRLAPEGHRPDDILRGAKSVVVVGGGQPSAGAWRAGKARHQASVGYNRSVASGAAQKLVHFIESEYGYYAMLCPPSLASGHYPYVSLKLLAEMAGLGTRSMAAGIVLNQTYGLLYYAAVLTSMPLEPDGPLSEPVCPHPSCRKLWERKGTTPCLEACPTCLSGELEAGAIRWMEYRQDRCFPRAQTTAMDIFQKMLLDAMDEPDRETRKAILFGSHFTRAVRSIAYSTELSAQCFECLRRCPVGRESRHRMK